MFVVSMLIGLVSLIPKIAYLLANSFVTILDVFQLFFRKLAGLDVYYVDGEAQTGDLVYQFIRGTVMGDYPSLYNVFWGLIILAIMLLVLSTIISIIRNEYTAEKDGNSKAKIVGKAFKAMAYFAIVPIVCLFGVYLANIVLVAVDKATTMPNSAESVLNTSLLEPYIIHDNVGSTGGSETTAPESTQTYIGYALFGWGDVGSRTPTFSGVVFKSCCWDANRVRGETQTITLDGTSTQVQGFFGLLQNDRATNFGGLFKDDGNDADKVALAIDVAFADTVKLKNGEKLKVTEEYIKMYNDNTLEPFGRANEDRTFNQLNRFNVTLVWYYYDLWKFDYIIMFGAGIIMVTIFTNVIFGLMKRLIELIGLFLISAPLVALMPLDDGKSYNNWRGKFLSKTLMAYGAVGGMNIAFIVLPIIQDISFFNIEPVDRIVDSIIGIVALLCVKSFIDMISGFVGGENAEKEGSGIAKDAGELVAKAGKMTAGAFAAPLMAGAMAGKAVGKGVQTAVKQHKAKKAYSAALDKWKQDTKEFNDKKIKDRKIAKTKFKGQIAPISDEIKSLKENNAKLDEEIAEAEEAEKAEKAEKAGTAKNTTGNNGSGGGSGDGGSGGSGGSGGGKCCKGGGEKDKALLQMAQMMNKNRMDDLSSKRKKLQDDYKEKLNEIKNRKAPEKPVSQVKSKGELAKSALSYTVKSVIQPTTRVIANLAGDAKGHLGKNGFSSGLSDASDKQFFKTILGTVKGVDNKVVKKNKEVEDLIKEQRKADDAKAALQAQYKKEGREMPDDNAEQKEIIKLLKEIKREM